MSELKLARGDDDVLEVTITKEDGTALDSPGLETFTDIWFTAKRRMSDPDEDAVILRHLGDGVELDADSDPEAASIVLVRVDAADTSSLPDHLVRLLWDVQVEDGQGVHTIANGTLAVSPDVTRATGAAS